MAKKITDEQSNPAGDTTEVTGTGNTPPENENTGNPESEKTDTDTQPVETALPETKTPLVPQSKPEASASVNYPPFVEAMLKAFPAYESLYIDSHGGTYAPQTSPLVRGNAVLYKNPYHK